MPEPVVALADILIELKSLEEDHHHLLSNMWMYEMFVYPEREKFMFM